MNPQRHIEPARTAYRKRSFRTRATSVAPRVLGIALAALLVLPSVEATQPAEAGKKFKTITRTFDSDGQIDIPDAGTQGPSNPFPTTIKVNDFKKFKKAKIKDVNLTLRDFSHARSENVDVMLVLGNKRAIVMGDAGNATDANSIDIVLDDQAGGELPDGAALVAGTFRAGNLTGADPFPAPAPAPNANDALSTFNGANPDGSWQLFVHDDANADTGSIGAGWELELTVKVKKDKKDKKNDDKDD
jgi:hypothetical protein